MPSFARTAPPENRLGAIFANDSSYPVEIIEEIRRESRVRAISILSKDLPETLIRLQNIINEAEAEPESEPEQAVSASSSPDGQSSSHRRSAFWAGHRSSAAFQQAELIDRTPSSSSSSFLEDSRFSSSTPSGTSPSSSSSASKEHLQARSNVPGTPNDLQSMRLGGSTSTSIGMPIPPGKSHALAYAAHGLLTPPVGTPDEMEKKDFMGGRTSATNTEKDPAGHLAAFLNRSLGITAESATATPASWAEDGRGREGEKSGMSWKGVLKSNAICEEVLKIVETECETIIRFCKDLDHWLSLEVPQIEDGNQFGTEVQDHMAKRIGGVINVAFKLHGLGRSHFADRMGMAMNWCKYPGLEDHKTYIAASDRFDHYLALNAIRTLRNSLASLLHLLRQNWEKTRNPKGSFNAAATMY